MHWVCGRSDLFALPLLMTGEEVRDIGVGAGVGQWAQQEVNGVRGLEAAGFLVPAQFGHKQQTLPPPNRSRPSR
jgi:hypothetical protein